MPETISVAIPILVSRESRHALLWHWLIPRAVSQRAGRQVNRITHTFILISSEYVKARSLRFPSARRRLAASTNQKVIYPGLSSWASLQQAMQTPTLRI